MKFIFILSAIGFMNLESKLINVNTIWDKKCLLFMISISLLTGIPETPIIVTWVTFGPTNTPQVQYWLHGDVSTNRTALGYSTKFVDGGIIVKTVRYIHRVKIAATLPTQIYGRLLTAFIASNIYPLFQHINFVIVFITCHCMSITN